MGLKSFVDVSPDFHCPLENLPFGVFRRKTATTGDHSLQNRRGLELPSDFVLDLSLIASTCLLDGPFLRAHNALTSLLLICSWRWEDPLGRKHVQPFKSYCLGGDYKIGFGTCTGKVLPAITENQKTSMKGPRNPVFHVGESLGTTLQEKLEAELQDSPCRVSSQPDYNCEICTDLKYADELFHIEGCSASTCLPKCRRKCF